MSLHSVDCLLRCAEDFEFDIIPFVQFCFGCLCFGVSDPRSHCLHHILKYSSYIFLPQLDSLIDLDLLSAIPSLLSMLFPARPMALF